MLPVYLMPPTKQTPILVEAASEAPVRVTVQKPLNPEALPGVGEPGSSPKAMQGRNFPRGTCGVHYACARLPVSLFPSRSLKAMGQLCGLLA